MKLHLFHQFFATLFYIKVQTPIIQTNLTQRSQTHRADPRLILQQKKTFFLAFFFKLAMSSSTGPIPEIPYSFNFS